MLCFAFLAVSVSYSWHLEDAHIMIQTPAMQFDNPDLKNLTHTFAPAPKRNPREKWKKLSTPSASGILPDVLQNIWVVVLAAPIVLVEHDIALGRNGIRSGTGLHASTLECLGGFECLLAPR
jgi:hypothetical protein